MKKYEYVTVNLAGKGLIKPKFEDYRAVIDEYAAKGYRYAGWIPCKTDNLLDEKVDLIFEIDAE